MNQTTLYIYTHYMYNFNNFVKMTLREQVPMFLNLNRLH
jgi:hypothetical protein